MNGPEDEPELAPELEELLARWVWDPADLDTTEWERLAADPSARRRMEGLRNAEDALARASDRVRDADVEDTLRELAAATREPEEVVGLGPRLASPAPQVDRGAGLTTWAAWAAMAATALLAFWVGGAFGAPEKPFHPATPDMPLGAGDRVEVRFDAAAARVRWSGEPSSMGVVRLRLFDEAGALLEERAYYEGDPEWETRAAPIDRASVGDVFGYDVRFENIEGLVERESGRQVGRD